MIFGPAPPTTPIGVAAAQAVLDHHHAVHRVLHLDGGRLYMRTEDRSALAQPWTAGFMFAVKRWPAVWRPMFERSHHVDLVLPIISCEPAEEVEKITTGRPGPQAILGEVYHHIPEPFAPSAIIGDSTPPAAELTYATPATHTDRGAQTTVTLLSALSAMLRAAGAGTAKSPPGGPDGLELF